MTAARTSFVLPGDLKGLWAPFDELTARQVHNLLRLRQDVFMLEQQCLFPEIDGKDLEALHFLLLTEDGQAAAALRVFLADGEGQGSRIGRVVVSKTWRGKQLGGYLMAEAMRKISECRPGQPVHLSAQAHLEAFYAGFGFRTNSELYLEDGIEHIDMVAEA